MNLEARFTKLTEEWLSVIGGEHHKDRDCHFYIERRWSYGDPPKWVAYHCGYWIRDWEYTSDDYEECLKEMTKMLTEEIKEARECIELTEKEMQEYNRNEP